MTFNDKTGDDLRTSTVDIKITQQPKDGYTYYGGVYKVVNNEDGKVLRTVQLDGETTIIKDVPADARIEVVAQYHPSNITPEVTSTPPSTTTSTTTPVVTVTSTAPKNTVTPSPVTVTLETSTVTSSPKDPEDTITSESSETNTTSEKSPNPSDNPQPSGESYAPTSTTSTDESETSEESPTSTPTNDTEPTPSETVEESTTSTPNDDSPTTSSTPSETSDPVEDDRKDNKDDRKNKEDREDRRDKRDREDSDSDDKDDVDNSAKVIDRNNDKDSEDTPRFRPNPGAPSGTENGTVQPPVIPSNIGGEVVPQAPGIPQSAPVAPAGKGAIVDTGGQVETSIWKKIADFFR